jgi:hypothetical protein
MAVKNESAKNETAKTLKKLTLQDLDSVNGGAMPVKYKICDKAGCLEFYF